MKIKVGMRVYFAKEYYDEDLRPGVLVRGEGTFYIGQTPPTGVNSVAGRITANRGEISFPIYTLYMTFRKQEVWSCHNENKYKRQNFERELQSTNYSMGIVLDSFEEASEVADLCHRKGISCTVSGKTITDYVNREAILNIIKSYRSKGGILDDYYDFSDEELTVKPEDDNFLL